MKTYVKIYGPPIVEALKALEDVAREFAKKHPGIKYFHYLSAYRTAVPPFKPIEDVTELRVIDFEDKLLSKSGWSLGEYDFYFEWERKPTFEELKELIGLIDKALAKVNCEYIVVTK